MPARVVDDFQAVTIAQHDGKRPIIMSSTYELLLEPLVESSSVEEAG
jgi:hypothetical protein